MADTAVIPKDWQFGFSVKGSTTITTKIAPTQCDVRRVPTRVVPTEEMAGQLGERSETVSDGPYTVTGGFNLVPRPDELDALFPLILGGALTGDVINPDYIDDGFTFSFDRKTRVQNYMGCKISRATFSSSPGQQLQMRCDLEGLTQTVASAGTFQSGLSLSLQQPYIHHQAAITLDGTAVACSSIEITYENELLLDRFESTQTRTELPHVGQAVSVSVDMEYGSDAQDFLDLGVAGTTGACSIIYTNGARSITFEFPVLQVAAEDPPATGKRSEMRQPLDFVARTKDGESITEIMKVTNDATA